MIVSKFGGTSVGSAENIKKVIQWYNLLVTSGLDFSAVEAEEENSEKV